MTAMGLVVLGCVLVVLGVAVAFSRQEVGVPVSAPWFGSADGIIRDVVQRHALAEERFRKVEVEVRDGIVNLTGRVKTGTDKWDARNAVWLKAQPLLVPKITAVFANIVSDEPDPMPAGHPGTPEDSAWTARQFGFIVLPPSPPVAPYPLTDNERRRTGHPYWDNRPDAPPKKP